MTTAAANPTLATLQEDVATLQRDVGTLLAHLKNGATASVQGSAEDLEERATRLYRSAATEGGTIAKEVGHRIGERPVLTALIVLGLGYIGGRLLTR